MRKAYQITSLICLAGSLAFMGCRNRPGGIWDDSRTSASYQNRSFSTPWGSDDESFLAQNSDGFIGPADEDFIPLKDSDLKGHFADGAIPQPKEDLGEIGSGIPGIEQFQAPTSQLAAIFRTVFFSTDDHILRGKEYIATVERIASYLKEHPRTYVVVEGHADERGPEAYNLSLGARRANYVRSLMVQKGVDLNQVHTISYGKERPVELGHNSQAWSKNRRAQFKIYQK